MFKIIKIKKGNVFFLKLFCVMSNIGSTNVKKGNKLEKRVQRGVKVCNDVI